MNTDTNTTVNDNIIETAKTSVKKPKLTAEEKRAKRNAYAREYYKNHADKRKAACKKCRQLKKAKAAEIKAQAQNAVPEQNTQVETVAPTAEVVAA